MYAGINPQWMIYQDLVYTVTGSEIISGGGKVIQIIASPQAMVFKNKQLVEPGEYSRDPGTGYLIVKTTTPLVAGDKIVLANLAELKFDHTYSRGQIDSLLASKVDQSVINTALGNYYTKKQVDTKTSIMASLWNRMI